MSVLLDAALRVLLTHVHVAAAATYRLGNHIRRSGVVLHLHAVLGAVLVAGHHPHADD